MNASSRYVKVCVFSWVLALFLSCSGAGGGLSGDDTSGSSDDTGGGTGEASNDLFTGGPVDLPIPIAKVEAIDPKYVTVRLEGASLTIEGQAGAVPNPTASPLVWAYQRANDKGRTVVTQSDGSFEAIEFTLESSTDTIEIALAGSDGEMIGTPIFLRVSDGTYVWILTNGATLTQEALAIENNRVYLVLKTTEENALQKGTSSRNRPTSPRAATVTSDLYALDIAGTPQIVASGNINIEQVLVTGSDVLVRDGSSFYCPTSNGSFESCLTIDSGDQVANVTATDDEDGEQKIAIVSDKKLYFCSRTERSCTTLITFSGGEDIDFMEWLHMPSMSTNSYTAAAGGLNLMVLTSAQGTSSTTIKTYFYDSDGVLMRSDVADIGTFADIQGVTLNETGQYVLLSKTQLSMAKFNSTGSVSASSFRPGTITQTCNADDATSSGDVFLTIQSSLTSQFPYLLDGEATYMFTGSTESGCTGQSCSNTQAIIFCRATKTRSICHVELHPNAQMVFFSAHDGDGNAHLFVYCPNRLDMSQSTSSLGEGDEIIELAEAECQTKNWKVDREPGDDEGENSAGSVVIVDTSTPALPQVQFIDPYTDPRFEGCIHTYPSWWADF